MNKNKTKIIICGGGTAGHIYPALAVLEKLKKNIQNLEILYIGSGNQIEQKILKNKNINFVAIPAGKIRRSLSLESTIKNIIDLFKLPLGFLKALIIIRKFKPQLIFSKGGYAGFLPTIAGYFLKIPIVIHESDIKMGLANKIASFFANKVAVAFPEKYYPGIKKEKLIFTGNPTREEIFKVKRVEALQYFNFSPQIKTLAILGGSQGARKINYTIIKILPQILKNFQVIHLSGWLDYEDIKKKTEKLPQNLLEKYRLFPYFENIGFVYAAADFFISRAGANVIFEIVGNQKPAIFIPLPGHQEENARFLADNLGYVVIKNNQLSAEILFEKIQSLSKQKLEIKNIFPRNSSQKIAQIIINILEKGK